MPDGLLLIGAGLVCLVVLVALLVREDRAAGRPVDPGWRGWLVLVLGVICTVAGSILAWDELFSR